MVTTPTDRSSWRRFVAWAESGPIEETEDSIPLRVLVQLLVFVGIAAADQVSEKGFVVWAIPLSGMAAGWGWYARRRRNIPVKFLIAFAMIGALISFLGDIVSGAEETRLLLTRLLIQLQVLHSFDLPRRRDLGYSIVIGFILMGVAGTISQTLVFGFWIVAFLALIIPVLVLDLRSQLKVDGNTWQLGKLGIAPMPMVTMLGLVMIGGLVIFTFLPRLPGYQIRNFPVSTTIINRAIPSGAIIRPGSTSQGQGNGSGSGTGGNGGEAGEGVAGLPPLFGEKFDATALVKIKPELVMRVRSQAALFWRVLAYDRYTGKGWQISRSSKKDIRTIDREIYNYKFELPLTIADIANPALTQEIIQTYTITTQNFPNLIPAASVPTQLFFPSEEIDIDPENNLRAPGILPLDLTYTVISTVPRREVALLQKAASNYTEEINAYYLDVPTKIKEAIRSKTMAILTGARNIVTSKPEELDNPYDQALYLTQHLKQNYRITDQSSFKEGEDLVSKFLQENGGAPSHFVSTLVLMLRSVGIPARYAVGFATGQFNPFTGYYEVMNTDTLSLAEVFFPSYGWFTFDPVPGNPLFPSSIEEDQTFSALSSFWKWIASFLPSPIVGFLSVLFNQIGNFFGSLVSTILRWLIGLGWIGIFVGILGLFAIALVLWALWQVLGLWSYQLRLSTLHPIQRIYQQMLQKLSERGLSKLPAQTPQEYAYLVASRTPPGLAAIVWEITRAYQDWRYGNLALLPVKHLQQLLHKLQGKGWQKINKSS